MARRTAVGHGCLMHGAAGPQCSVHPQSGLGPKRSALRPMKAGEQHAGGHELGEHADHDGRLDRGVVGVVKRKREPEPRAELGHHGHVGQHAADCSRRCR